MKTEKLTELLTLLQLVEGMPVDYFETHSDENFVIVFKLCFYNHQGILDGVPQEADTVETKINMVAHKILLKSI